MATSYPKPAVRRAWAETPPNGAADLQDPGDTYTNKGWQLGVKPPRQYFNWVLNYVMAGIRYLCQQGVAQWDAQETYSIGSMVISPAGNLVRSIINNNVGINPDLVTSSSSWQGPQVPTPVSSDRTGVTPNTSWVGNNFLPTGSTFSAIGGQVSNGQVPVGAVTQWQGSLTIAGGQISSAVARANTLLLPGNGGQYATFNWITGSGSQPVDLFGSNDGVNVYVWNPSNFSVNNSNLLAGLAPTASAVGNTVVLRDASGYLYAQYLNQASGNNENPSISQIMVTNGGDGFLRKASVSALKAALGALAASDFPDFLSPSSMYKRIAPDVIIQAGSAFVSGTTFITFPTSFPTACVGFVLTNVNSTNQIFISSTSASGATVTNGSATVNWIALGY